MMDVKMTISDNATAMISDLQSRCMFKQRSSETHCLYHIPLLSMLPDTPESSHPPQLQIRSRFTDDGNTTGNPDTELTFASGRNSPPITCLLLGDSMFERFLSTGRRTRFGSSTNISEHEGHADFESAMQHQSQFPYLTNVSVGGDRICNVAYRLVSDSFALPSPASVPPPSNLLTQLCRVGGARVIFLCMGTNDLRGDKNPISGHDIDTYALIIEVLGQRCPGLQNIFVCGVNPRLKVKKGKEGIVAESNEMIEAMIKVKSEEWKREDKMCGLEFVEAEKSLVNCLEEDKVHLNEEGYQVFANIIWERLRSVLDS